MMNKYKYINDLTIILFVALVFLAMALVGCGSSEERKERQKEAEAALYDNVAEGARECCAEEDCDLRGNRFPAKTRPWQEWTRDVWQRTYYDQGGPIYHHPDIGVGGRSGVWCPGDEHYPEELDTYLCDTGWNPGECASEWTTMGCAPEGWTVSPEQEAEWADCKARLNE